MNVRRAIAFALDREAITKAAKFGAATANQTAIPEEQLLVLRLRAVLGTTRTRPGSCSAQAGVDEPSPWT